MNFARRWKEGDADEKPSEDWSALAEGRRITDDVKPNEQPQTKSPEPLPEAASDSWQPIKTAPKDTSVTVRMRSGKIYEEAHWASDPQFASWFVPMTRMDGCGMADYIDIPEPKAWRPLTPAEPRKDGKFKRDMEKVEAAKVAIKLYSPCTCGSGKKFKFCCYKP